MKRSHEKYEEERYLNINYRIYDKVYTLKDITYIPECESGFFRTKKVKVIRGRTIECEGWRCHFSLIFLILLFNNQI